MRRKPRQVLVVALFLRLDFNLTVGPSGLVIEDAPSGLKAGHAAGAKTLAVCTSHTRQEILGAGANPDYIVKDLSRFVVLLV